MTGSATVLRADARHLPLPDASVDLIVTSPPYFALRSYSDGGEHYDGQLGDEPSPSEFLDALWACTAEWQRVLKPSGSLFVNLGDKYAERNGPPRTGGADDNGHFTRPADRPARGRREVRTKSLMGLPWRYAIGCIDGDAGKQPWILRAEVVWQKPNAMPEAVKDRVRRTHEQWFHLVLRQRYYESLDEIREPHTGGSHHGRKDGAAPPGGRLERLVAAGDRSATVGSTDPDLFDPRGRTPGSVWSIPSEALVIPADLLRLRDLPDHFAVFPQEWPRRLILGWSPGGICVECGTGRRPVTEVEQIVQRAHNATGRPKRQDLAGADTNGFNGVGYPSTVAVVRVLGYECRCSPHTAQKPPPTRPAVVLDPFGGTGTVAGVARALGRHGISVDLSHDYCRLARWRIFESGHFTKTAQRTWSERQGTLFDVARST